MRMYKFADYFFSMILDIQKDQPNLIAPDIDVIKNYRLSRSEGCVDTKISQASKVTGYFINWMNFWNIGEEDVVHGPMRDVYSEPKKMLETFLAFSLPLWSLL